MQSAYKPNDQPTVSIVIFFDGVCGLCNRFVDFVIKRDSGRIFRFSPLQGKNFEELRGKYPWVEGQNSIVVLFRIVNRDVVFFRSRAVFFILNELGGGWKILSILKVIPAPITDLVYRIISKIRYRLFGKKESCRLPTPEERTVFLD